MDIGAEERVDGRTAAETLNHELTDIVRGAVRAELDQVLPHVVAALKRNEAVAALTQRLDRAEKQVAEQGQRPLIRGLHGMLGTVRRLDFDGRVKDAIVGELERLLVGAGYTEFGEVGEPYDPQRFDAIAGEASDGRAFVSEVFEPGLETLGMTLVKAKVRVTPTSASSTIDHEEAA